VRSVRRNLSVVPSEANAAGPWLSHAGLERHVLEMMRSLPGFSDVTSVDIEAVDPSASTGDWLIVRIWRGHVVELPGGSTWDETARTCLRTLRSSLRLDPRSRPPEA
jgi:hypothetical protein